MPVEACGALLTLEDLTSYKTIYSVLLVEKRL